MTKREWWQHFDEGMGTILFEEPEIFKPSKRRTLKEVNEILRRTRLKKGSLILDLACGIGRHSKIFAEKTFKVTGLDYSHQFIRKAVHLTPQRLTKSLRYVRGDMRELVRFFPNDSFDLVVCLWNSFGYFDKRADDLRVLRQVQKILKRGGHFVLNTFNRSGVELVAHTLPKKIGLPEKQIWNIYKPGHVFMNRFGFDPKNSRTYGEYILVDIKEGHMKRYPHQDNVYTTAELEKMLVTAGLQIRAKWGALEGDKLTKYSFTQTLLAQK